MIDTKTYEECDGLSEMTEKPDSQQFQNGTIYCGVGWTNFWAPFLTVFVPLKMLICSIGLLGNIFNLIVYRMKGMKNPTNKILTSLAFTDLLCVVREIGNVIIQQSTKSSVYYGGGTTYNLALSQLINEILLMLFHSWSTYLTLFLACWRLSVTRTKSKTNLGFKAAKVVILLAILFGIGILPPMYYSAYIKCQEERDGREYFFTHHSFDAYLWIHAILIKIIPCFVMTFVSLALVWNLRQVQRNWEKVFGCNKDSSSNCQLEFNRTTRMLVVVLVIFLITEFPFGVMNVLAIFMGSQFSDECKLPALPFFNFCEYISSAVSFFVYFRMSENFKNNFIQIFYMVQNRIGNLISSKCANYNPHKKNVEAA